MIRGAIDHLDDHRVRGWAHADDIPVRGRMMLAFIGDRCIGSGRVDRFRRDLADVGLGDGWCGYDFAITPPSSSEELGRLFVKFECSDFILLHRDAEVIARPVETTVPKARFYSRETLEWMQARGWIDAAEQGFLRDMAACRPHVRMLTGTDTPEAIARRLLELYLQAPARLQSAMIQPRNLGRERIRLIDGAAAPVIAIHADGGEVASPTLSKRYALAADRLLLIDASVAIDGSGINGATVFRAG